MNFDLTALMNASWVDDGSPSADATLVIMSTNESTCSLENR